MICLSIIFPCIFLLYIILKCFPWLLVLPEHQGGHHGLEDAAVGWGIITRSSASGNFLCMMLKATQQRQNRKLHQSGKVLLLLMTQNPQEPSGSVPLGTWQVSGGMLWHLDPPYALNLYDNPGHCQLRAWVCWQLQEGSEQLNL